MVINDVRLATDSRQQAALYSAPRYAFIWNVDAKKVEILGSLQDPMLSATSIVHGVLQVPKATKYFLGHQNGNKVAWIYLQLFDPPSSCRTIRRPPATRSRNS